MLKHYSFFFLLLALILCACNPAQLTPAGAISAEINGVHWETLQPDEILFEPATGKLSLKGTDNGQKIHLYAEDLTNVGSTANFSLSSPQMMPMMYCAGFDPQGNPLPVPCGWTYGFRLESNTLKWLIQSNCEENVAGFSWLKQVDSQNFVNVSNINAIGNATSPNDYSLDANEPIETGSYVLRSQQTLQDGTFAFSNVVKIIKNGVFTDNQGNARYCGGTISLIQHDANTHKISGTFSLNTIDASGNVVNITQGTFNELLY